MTLALCLLIAVVGAASLASNKDWFSPTKLMLGSTCIVFFDVFRADYPLEILAIFSGLVAMAGVLAATEAYQSGRVGETRRATDRSGRETSIPGKSLARVTIFLWLATLAPLLGQWLLIEQMGGFESYINVLQIRVSAFRGFGYLLALVATIYPINLTYFGIGLAARPGRRWWMLYGLHLALQLALALLSSSRGLVVLPLAHMLIVAHYLRRRVSVLQLTGMIAGLLLLVGLLGVARQGYRITADGQILTGFRPAESLMNVEHFKYGLWPLQTVLAAEITDPKYGMTFVSAVTNYVPRSFWPGKPDSGGVVITREYLNDPWRGNSYISTGIIAESILNIGHGFGIAAGFLIYAGIVALLIRVYVRMRQEQVRCGRSYATLRRVLRYVYFGIAVASLASGEFTNAVFTMFNNLLTIWALDAVIRRILEVRFEKTPVAEWQYA